MKIITDSREKHPLVFPLEYDVIVQGLKTGDYSLVGYEDTVCVERKNIGDLTGCLSTGRNRFRKQLARLKEIPYRCVVIESSLFQVSRKRYYGYLTPDEVIQGITELSVEFKVPFTFTDNAQLTARYVLSFLKSSKERIDKLAPSP